MLHYLGLLMKTNDPIPENTFDPTVFEIPPAAAYFETIQELQKVNAKLDVLIRNQCEIKAVLNKTDAVAEQRAVRREVAERYETLLLRYFEETDVDLAALRNTIHPDDRGSESDGTSYTHTSRIG